MCNLALKAKNINMIHNKLNANLCQLLKSSGREMRTNTSEHKFNNMTHNIRRLRQEIDQDLQQYLAPIRF